MSDVVIEGRCDEGFGAVADAFAANFSDYKELGAGFSLYVAGEEKINLWGGISDKASQTPWTDQTLQLVFSTTKGAVALCVAHLVDKGQLRYDDTVAQHWPEFAAEGKEHLTVGEMLSHQGGLIALNPPMGLDEILQVQTVVQNLAAQVPSWPRQEGHGYHAITYGWLASELIARVDGRRVGQYFAEEIAAPLGLDFWIGLPSNQEHRVSTVEAPWDPDPELGAYLAELYQRGANGYRALTLDGALRVMPTNNFNEPRVHAAEVPGANGITSARSLARMYAAAIGPVDGNSDLQVIDESTMNLARLERSAGPDKTLLVPTRFGAGFWLPDDLLPMIADGSFGHPGAGGSLGFANPELGVGFGYVMNQMSPAVVGDPRSVALAEAVAVSLGV